MPNLLKVTNKNVQLSKCPKIFFSGTSIVKHLTVTYAYFFYNRVNLQASKDYNKSYMVSIQPLYSSFHQKIKSIKYNAKFAITAAIRGLLEKNPTEKQTLDL